MLEGIADFGLVSFPRKSPKLTAVPWRAEPMMVVCQPQHPLAQQESVHPKDLAKQRYVHFDKNLDIRRKVDRFLREQGVNLHVECEFDNIENIKQAVVMGVGVALLPEPTIRREVETGLLVAKQLEGCQLVRPMAIIQRKRHKLTSTAQRFLDLLREGQNGQANSSEIKSPFASSSPSSRSPNRVTSASKRKKKS